MNGELYRRCVKVFFDLETTGLRRKTSPPDEIVQICASAEGEDFVSYCRPTVRKNWAGLLPSRSSRPTSFDIHGIGPDRVREAPTWRELGREFQRFVRRASRDSPAIVLVAYNGWAFDASFMAANNELHGILGFDRPVYVCDPLRISRLLAPGVSHKQVDVYARLFRESFANAHDAAADVRALRRICEHPSFAPRLAGGCRRFESLEGPRRPVSAGEAPRRERPDGSLRAPKAKVHPKSSFSSARSCESCGVVYSSYFNHECK